MKKKIGIAAGLILVLAVVLVVVKMVLPQKGEKESETISYDFGEFTAIEMLRIEQTEEVYEASAIVTIPDMALYIEEFSTGGSLKEGKWEKVEGKVAGEFYHFLKKQDPMEQVKYIVELDLKPYAEEYVSSLEYLSSLGIGENEPEKFAFTEKQVVDMLWKEAIRMNLKAKE